MRRVRVCPRCKKKNAKNCYNTSPEGPGAAPQLRFICQCNYEWFVPIHKL